MATAGALPVYVGRVMRGEQLIHAQRGTLPELAILAHSGRTALDLAIGGGDPIGKLHFDGRVEWYDAPKPTPENIDAGDSGILLSWKRLDVIQSALSIAKSQYQATLRIQTAPESKALYTRYIEEVDATADIIREHRGGRSY